MNIYILFYIIFLSLLKGQPDSSVMFTTLRVKHTARDSKFYVQNIPEIQRWEFSEGLNISAQNKGMLLDNNHCTENGKVFPLRFWKVSRTDNNTVKATPVHTDPRNDWRRCSVYARPAVGNAKFFYRNDTNYCFQKPVLKNAPLSCKWMAKNLLKRCCVNTP